MLTLIEEESSGANRGALKSIESSRSAGSARAGILPNARLAAPRLVAFQANKYRTEAALPCPALLRPAPPQKMCTFSAFMLPPRDSDCVLCFTVSLDGLVSGDWGNDSACGIHCGR